jgi:hypothetical protein
MYRTEYNEFVRNVMYHSKSGFSNRLLRISPSPLRRGIVLAINVRSIMNIRDSCDPFGAKIEGKEL